MKFPTIATDQKQNFLNCSFINLLHYFEVRTRLIKLIELETAEADDVIAVLIRKVQRVVGPNHAKKIIIVSGDKDFIQLDSDNVRQYNPILNKYVGKDETPSIYIREHILKGDRSDGVPNILSDDNVFIELPIICKRLSVLLNIFFH